MHGTKLTAVAAFSSKGIENALSDIAEARLENPGLRGAYDRAEQFLRSVSADIESLPDGDVMTLDEGVEVIWFSNNLHLQIFFAAKGEPDYIYTTTSDGANVKDGIAVPVSAEAFVDLARQLESHPAAV